jgi:hypothetical protein
MSPQTKPSIVFCHGIWADGSCFSLDHPGVDRAWLLIVLVSVFDSHVRFPFW